MNFDRQFTDFLTNVRKDIQSQFDSTGLNASGFARNSLKVVANQFLKAEIRGRRYTAYLETGFKEKPKSIGRRFIDGLISWMKSRGIQPQRRGEIAPYTEDNIKRSAFNIARSIVKTGTSINKGRKGLNFEEAINANMTPFLESVGAEFVVSFTDKLKIKRK